MGKKYLKCANPECGHIQAVKSDEMWGCSVCKKIQLVDERAVRTETNRGGRLCLCSNPKCGHVQAVKVEIWLCYKCRKTQLTAKTVMPAAGARKPGRGTGARKK